MGEEKKLPYEAPEARDVLLDKGGVAYAANEGSYMDPNYDPEESL